MATLKDLMTRNGYAQVQTILNSGNILFQTQSATETIVKNNLETLLGDHFQFSIPVIIRPVKELQDILRRDPFRDIPVSDKFHFYITFLPKKPPAPPDTPWSSSNGGWKVLDSDDRHMISLVDREITKTTDAMKDMEKMYGKNITTRNWNTLLRLEQLWKKY